ncbi:hypothetical protein QSI_3307 [Clostridioides difficile P28]|nr:hypothetical protein QSI_3307 [Clostridioides difficile P28]
MSTLHMFKTPLYYTGKKAVLVKFFYGCVRNLQACCLGLKNVFKCPAHS